MRPDESERDKDNMEEEETETGGSVTEDKGGSGEDGGEGVRRGETVELIITDMSTYPVDKCARPHLVHWHPDPRCSAGASHVFVCMFLSSRSRVPTGPWSQIRRSGHQHVPGLVSGCLRRTPYSSWRKVFTPVCSKSGTPCAINQ